MERPNVLRAVRLGAAISLLAIYLPVPVLAAAAGVPDPDTVLFDDSFDDGNLMMNTSGQYSG